MRGAYMLFGMVLGALMGAFFGALVGVCGGLLGGIYVMSENENQCRYPRPRGHTGYPQYGGVSARAARESQERHAKSEETEGE